MRKIRSLAFMLTILSAGIAAKAQPDFPVNGVADPREKAYAFIHANIVQDGNSQLQDATLLIRKGKIEGIGKQLSIPADAVIIDCIGKYIYPSFIDLYTDYGMPATERSQARFSYGSLPQLTSNRKGAFGWNQAIRSDVQAADLFSVDDAKAKPLRMLGFGTVLTHQHDGIARGTGVLVTLANERENTVMLKEKASAHYSFDKGSSGQSYPSSLMGSIALLRQTYLDAGWYKQNPDAAGVNLTLKYWNDSQGVPQIFEANDKWNDLRADRIGDEFGVQYILKAGGNEYQRISEMAATHASFILPLNYPAAMETDDLNELRFVGLDDLKHWELAPGNPAAFEKAGIPFCLSTADLSNVADFAGNLKKAIRYGLSEAKALDALTAAPAKMLGVYDKVGSLEKGKLANFLIVSGPLFHDQSQIIENWIQGEKYAIKEEAWHPIEGLYTFRINEADAGRTMQLEVKKGGTALFIAKDTMKGKVSQTGTLLKLNYAEAKGKDIIMSGAITGNQWAGTGKDAAGKSFTWSALKQSELPASKDSSHQEAPLQLGKVTYPFIAYGFEEMPRQEDLLIQHATIWTNEKVGVLKDADILLRNGKIAAIGKGLTAKGAKVIDASGKHVTAGIIDEHSHIATASINEGGQSVTSEVRIGDNLNPEDINIYRQLSGGVTTSHILHGSANTIGGQTQLIKLRWGADDEGLKFKGADPFIKFALGENVKRTYFQMGNNRFPDTRMGVEQVMMDAFQRASDYQAAIKKAEAEAAKNKKGGAVSPWSKVRRDLELDALVEIMNSKRFITCHSYVQSEITSTMRVAEHFGFRINTFTHILEGYKVADKMKAHGANASTFSDWWNYKMEVVDAIPYNATIMHKVGLNVAINSDDAEMARRLNQEAAKSIKYGGMSEEDALKMVTINPAKMLHVDDRVGSLKVGKDADVVIWSADPLSIYAIAEKTIVDGTIYFDRERDSLMRQQIQAEKARLIHKMEAEKSAPGGGAGHITRPRPRYEIIHVCSDHYHDHGLLSIDEDDVKMSTGDGSVEAQKQ